MKVFNMTSPRTGAKVANQFIIVDDDRIVFQSYNSTCAAVTNHGRNLDLFDDFDYSVTTAKYCKAFISEYFNGDTAETWKAAKAGQRIFEVK